MRVSYLKPSDPRWPDKKYGEYWAHERQAYLNTINDIPLGHIKVTDQRIIRALSKP